MFGVRFWGLSIAYSVAAALLIGVPTVLIPNGFFARMTPTGPQDYVIWIISVALIGPLLALMTLYPSGTAHGTGQARVAGNAVNLQGQASTQTENSAQEAAINNPAGGWRTMIGGLLSYFSVGCPVCNKIVLLFLGTSGAMSIFNPLRPFLGASGVALLAVTLYLRVRVLRRGCPV